MRLKINNEERRRESRTFSQRPGNRYSDNPPNFGSARSDYGDRAYGGRLNQQGMERGWWDKTTDEVSAWFGDREAERRRRMDERRNRIRDRNYGQRVSANYPLGFYPIEAGYSPSNVYLQNWEETRVREVMTENVVTVHPSDPAQYAARLMGEYDCGAIPVVDWQNRMIGMITDRDIAIRLVGNNMNPAFSKVADCMTDKAFACHVNDSLKNCLRSMSRHQIRRMPIVDDYNRVVGIISQGDLAQHASQNVGNGERRAISDVVCAISQHSQSSYR
jgi:CBS domain-containing protein